MEYIQPHISIKIDKQVGYIVIVDDWELSDYIDDYLTEECDFDYVTTIADNGNSYEMHFDKKFSFDELKKAIKKLNKNEIERIYKLNN